MNPPQVTDDLHVSEQTSEAVSLQDAEAQPLVKDSEEDGALRKIRSSSPLSELFEDDDKPPEAPCDLEVDIDASMMTIELLQALTGTALKLVSLLVRKLELKGGGSSALVGQLVGGRANQIAACFGSGEIPWQQPLTNESSTCAQT